MSVAKQPQEELFSDSQAPVDTPGPNPISGNALRVVSAGTQPLTKVQTEFNRLMKSLEKSRADHERERRFLDKTLATAIRELMPLVEDLNRANRDMVFAGKEILSSMKMTKRRKEWFADLLLGKAADLADDGVGLDPDDFARLDEVIAELEFLAPGEPETKIDPTGFEVMRGVLESQAKMAGVELDLSGLDFTGDSLDFERQLHERLLAAKETLHRQTEGPRGPKPTKAQLAKEQRLREQEEAKKRDIKTLYKQLAKVLHPDLETDPLLKAHKEAWMKRLTTAYANGDLRDLLEIELEWLGEEAGNLARATDAKLKVYNMVLKEQIAEIKEQTQSLIDEPQYGTLHRFFSPFCDRPQPPERIKPALLDEIARHQEMLAVLLAGGPECKRMVAQWADHNARDSSRPWMF